MEAWVYWLLAFEGAAFGWFGSSWILNELYSPTSLGEGDRIRKLEAKGISLTAVIILGWILGAIIGAGLFVGIAYFTDVVGLV